MKECKVVKILKEPEKIVDRLDKGVITYWSVNAILEREGEQYESSVTFEEEKEAQKLKVEDVFFR